MTEPEKQTDAKETKITYFGLPLVCVFSLCISVSILWPSSLRQFYFMISQLWYWYLMVFYFFITYLLIDLIKIATVRLDRKYKWEDGFLKRAFLQLLFGGVVAAGIMLLLCWLYVYVFNVDIARLLRINYIFLIVIMLNMMYGFYYYVKLVHASIKTSEEGKQKNQFRDYFIVPEGIGEITLKLTEIAYLFRDDRDVCLRTFNGNSHPVLQSLDDIQKDLDPRLFFRLNRTHIMNVKAFVTADKNTKKGLDVTIIHTKGETGLKDEEVRITDLSREKVRIFRAWLISR